MKILINSFIIIFLLSTSAYSADNNCYNLYRIKDVSIIDGDTFDATINLGFSISVRYRFRMDGYDSPETYNPKTKAEKDAGIQVKSYLTELLNTYKDQLYLKTGKVEIYNRYPATVYISECGGTTVNSLVRQYIIDNHLTKEEVRK